MSPNSKSDFEELDEQLKGIDLSSDVSDDGLEILKDELQERIDSQEEREYYYLDLGFQSARTVIVLLGIFVSAVALLINQDLLSPGDLSSIYFATGVGFAIISLLSGTLFPLFVGYFNRRKQQEVDQESTLIAQDPDLIYSKNQILSFVVEQKVRIIERRHKNVGLFQMLALLSLYSLLASAALIGYTILASI